MKLPTNTKITTSAYVLLGGLTLSHAGVVSWGPVGTGIQVGDLIVDGTPYAAVNGGSDAAGAVTIGDNVFTVGPINSAVVGTVSNTGNGGFYTPSSGDANLDVIMDSHTYISGGNPTGQGQIDIPVTPGNSYMVQFIGVGDDRGCCGTRVQFVADGNGNISGGLTRGTGDWVVGTFIADTPNQSFFVTGENDPGLSGLIVRDLGSADDADNDGLFDGWETANGLNPNNDDSDGDTILDGNEDEDMDGLTNLGEQEQGTDITKDDTDDDGYLDGVETNTGTWKDANDTGSSPIQDDSDGDGLKDGVENPDLNFVNAAQTGSNPNLVDTDSDNLPDGVEVTLLLDPNNEDTDGNGTNDDGEDSDADGSSNGEELVRSTDPADDDTDDDGFKDGAETNTGTWVSANDTGTDPLNKDSDGDTILDGVENHDLPFNPGDPTGQPGTDPNLADSDGDLRSDDFELSEGSNPTDPNSFTAQPEIIFLPGLLGGDLTDPENDGIDTENTAGENFNWVSISSSEKSFFSDATVGGVNEGSFDIFDNKVGGGESKWCCGNAPQDITVEFEEAVSLTHFTITSGNDTPGRDPVDWQIQGSDDGLNFTPIFTHTGSSIWTDRNQTALVTLTSPSDPYKFIRYSVTATGINVHQLNEIEYFGEVGGQPLTITDIAYNQDSDAITLTWTSKPGRTYTVFANDDLMIFETDINDSVQSGGDSTTLTFPNPSPGAPKQFFQVVEN